MKSPTLENYVRHASKYGGVAVVWETASADLPAELLPQLTAELKAIAKRRRESFRIPRSAKSPDPAKSADSSQASQAVSRHKMSREGNPSSRADAPSESRTCASPWCEKRLPSSLRSDARYCPGGRCKQAAHRARRAA